MAHSTETQRLGAGGSVVLTAFGLVAFGVAAALALINTGMDPLPTLGYSLAFAAWVVALASLLTITLAR